MRTYQRQIVGKESSKWKQTQRAVWLQSLKSILEPPVRPSPERVVLPVSSLPPSFIPLSSTHLAHPQPTLWGHLSLSAELRESFVRVCVWACERVCVSGLLISLGCCRFKLFIPTAPAHTHTHTHAHLHHMPARIRPPERRSPWQPYQRSQISAREMK